VTASTVDEAFAIIHAQPVDAIVTDIMMPGKTGLDLLIEVKHDYPHIPVIMITGHTQRYGPKDVIAMGADGYFAKPFHNLELVFTLGNVLAHRERLNTNRAQAPASQSK
jgi:DNA-binding response OmpR family regulator